MQDVIIIGCGVTGAACAYALSRYNCSVSVLEADNDVANGTTKANSAIIHAGYDPRPGTKMAELNVRGSRMTKELCKRLDVPYKEIGSLVLALSEADMDCIRELYRRGTQNGVEGLQLLDAGQVRNMEPNLTQAVLGALYAPTAGIISPWEYCLAMAETAVRNGVELRRRCRVTAIRKEPDGTFTVTAGGEEFHARYVVNAAGVWAGHVHELIGEKEFTIHPVRGEYYLLDKSEGNCVHHVIFQCPSEVGKGVLVSPTVHGNLIVGPTAEPCGPEDLGNTVEGLAKVRRLAVRSVPDVNFRENIRNFSGIRANSDAGDFILRESRSVPHFVDAAGICSPGLSSAPAIGEYLVELLGSLGLPLEKKQNYIDTRRRIRFAELPDAEKNALIRQDPRYGRVICRCETVTEGEIAACLQTPIPPYSVNGVKRRVSAGMGRCQGGFCGPRVQELLAKHYGVSEAEIMMDADGTFVLTGQTKGGEA